MAKKPNAPCSPTKFFHKTVSTAVQFVDISGVPQGFDEIIVHMTNPYAGNAIYTVKPENTSANQTQIWTYQDWGSAPSSFTVTDFLWLGTGDASAVLYDGEFSLRSTLGIRRKFAADAGCVYSTTGQRLSRALTNRGFWNDIVTPISFIRIVSNQPFGMAVGCEIDAWAIKY
jgi:hypothetical protein